MDTEFFAKEKECLASGHSIIAGVDEAGRGPLAGPVVAAAVAYKHPAFGIPEDLLSRFASIRDSKKLSSRRREEALGFIQEHFHIGIGFAEPVVIDRLNILQATFLAMKGAVTLLRKQLPREGREGLLLLVDGNQTIPNLSLDQEAIIGGDDLVKSIAAASIAAKVTRDRMFEEFEERFPGYGFAAHKGYGTREHMDALRRLGPCPIHRLSFRPVALSIPENVNRKYFGR